MCFEVLSLYMHYQSTPPSVGV